MDRNPASESKICPKCNKKSFRLGISTKFVRHYYCYCKECDYKTESSISENFGYKEWFDADVVLKQQS
jgi:transcription elongation factor Elf1